MLTFRADLHCHTTCSDGSLSPAELIDLAIKTPLQGLSITDHDTIAAYSHIKTIPNLLIGTGVEFSCHFMGKSVHILGYDFSLESQELQKLCEWHQNRRQIRNELILQKLKKIGKPIEESELKTEGTVGRPHIAEAMVRKGYVQNEREAFNLYLGDGKPCYDPGPTITIEETMRVLTLAGGKTFLAHPHLLDGGIRLKELLKLPFDGIECHYAKCTPQQEKRWLKIAAQKNWLISGGSDFHGSIKPHIPLGCSWVDEQAFHSIFQNSL